MAWSHGKSWSDELIEFELRWQAKTLGRMPTANELRRIGRMDLAMAVSRSGGFRSWAGRIGVELKGTETHRGNSVEDAMVGHLEKLGFRVDRQSTRAPFDLLVDGVKVDVKSGSQTGPSGAHTFGSMKIPATCDLYLACFVDGIGRIFSRYFIPASEARVVTLSIRPFGKGKYERFREAHSEIVKLRNPTEAS